jgi:1-acyl-sn-glycerol-3-phosphate acyltransferase
VGGPVARVREKGGWAVALSAVTFYPLTWLLAKRRMEGLEHVPAEGPALLVCNHVSYLDPVYTAVFVHRAKRVPRFLAKASLWDVPVLGRVLSGSRQIPVSRGSADAGASLEAARASFDDDGVVVIYPEGTITRDEAGWPMAARSGAARLALQRRGVPVIPVVHWGTLSVYDHYRRRFRPSRRTTITVKAGEPIPMDDLRARVAEAEPGRERMAEVSALREATDRMMTAVRELLGEVRGEPVPAPVRGARGTE